MTKNPVEQFFADLADEIDKAFPETADEKDAPVEDPKLPVEPVDELSVEGLSLEAVRLLKKAENTDYVDEAEQLIRIADRYIRLTELAIHADINL